MRDVLWPFCCYCRTFEPLDCRSMMRPGIPLTHQLGSCRTLEGDIEAGLPRSPQVCLFQGAMSLASMITDSSLSKIVATCTGTVPYTIFIREESSGVTTPFGRLRSLLSIKRLIVLCSSVILTQSNLVFRNDGMGPFGFWPRRLSVAVYIGCCLLSLGYYGRGRRSCGGRSGKGWWARYCRVPCRDALCESSHV